MFTIEELEMFSPVVLQKLRLAVDTFIMFSEESIDILPIFWRDAFECMFLNFFELCYHFLVHFKVLGTIGTRVSERFASHTSENEETCHTERRVDEDTKIAAKLFGIHRSHGCRYDEIGMDVLDLLVEERHGICRKDWDVG